MTNELRLLAGAATLALTGFVSVPAQATIAGSITLGSPGVIPVAGNLSNNSQFELSEDMQTTGLGVGSFSEFPLSQELDTTDGSTHVSLDLNDIGAFTFGSADFGQFTASTLQILTQTANNLDIYITGMFTAGSFFGTDGGSTFAASDHISMNETGSGTGASISWGATFASPPAPLDPPVGVPEPISFTLVGAGLIGFVLLRRQTSSVRPKLMV